MSLRTSTLPGFGIAAADVPPPGGILLGAAEAGRCTGMTWLLVGCLTNIWWFQTLMDYFPFHIWDVIRNPLTMVIAPPFWDDPTCCCCSQGKCQIGAALSHWERARVNAGLFVEENSGVP